MNNQDPANDIVHKITSSIIANQIALNKNEAIRHTQFYKREIKKRINLLLPELISAEKDFDAFFNNVEDSTVQVYEVYDKFIEAVASIPIWECGNLTAVIEAFKKDPKSMQGIVNKINRTT